MGKIVATELDLSSVKELSKDKKLATELLEMDNRLVDTLVVEFSVAIAELSTPVVVGGDIIEVLGKKDDLSREEMSMEEFLELIEVSKVVAVM